MRRVAEAAAVKVRRATRSATGFAQGYALGRRLRPATGPPGPAREHGRLERSFDGNLEGPGIWKGRHYFDIYERHFGRFVDRPVTLVEVGVYSGGSLRMWREYLGRQATIHGVDIEPACTVYEEEGIHITIGDQSDPAFWERFRREVPHVDILIDDGGHETHQQIATLEAMLEHLQPGGVYLCEDVHRRLNPFHAYVDGLARHVNAEETAPAAAQQHIASVHRYSSVVVIEKPLLPVEPFELPRRGTEWQPHAP